MRRTGFILFTLVVLSVLVKLGMWQISRGQEKEMLTAALKLRGEQTFYSVASLPDDPLWYRVRLSGEYDHSKAILLDNQLDRGRPGYHLFYPFRTENGAWVLVNLGWLPAPQYRDELPVLPEFHGQVMLTGMVAPSTQLPELSEAETENGWPRRVQNIKPQELADATGLPLPDWVIQIAPDDPLALKQNWQAVVMGPEKHYAYAVQWFLLALAVAGLAWWWLKRSTH
ncbi:SURF1 family protein [Photobacterium halotolerans]|uniref:SURF1-like protein n=1 Tax=Photobacterium halotolerans TaxID=265726 RepID=A0A7X5BJN0_9GAMM|nr:SURF1 family protein [Photobacterium halotolerans]NAW65722.1 SURF1 family protein [Photobacterium halotolerans]NAW88081.1 SURF1 family protein [Photobacterium halotolerans]NAX45573.1 SURF1 family protein [Photobacterium halotolerans]